MQPFFFDDDIRRNFQCTNFRGENQIPVTLSVVSQIIPRWTQTVSVQHCPHDVAICENNGCRAVPRFHHRCIILIECFLFPAHGWNVLPWFRNGCHDCQRQIHAGHHHKFQCVVQPCRVRTSDIQHRDNIFHPVTENIAFQDVFPTQHLIHISGDGIDFAVVYHHPVRMRTLPAWIGVGTESRVHDTNCRMIIRTVQILVEQPQLLD